MGPRSQDGFLCDASEISSCLVAEEVSRLRGDALASVQALPSKTRRKLLAHAADRIRCWDAGIQSEGTGRGKRAGSDPQLLVIVRSLLVGGAGSEKRGRRLFVGVSAGVSANVTVGPGTNGAACARVTPGRYLGERT